MKRSLFILCAAVALAFTACDKELDNENGLLPDETTAEKTDGTLSDGYFRATFFPQQGENTATRAALNGESTAIQSLICIIYQEQPDGTLRFIEQRQVLTYDGPAASETQEIQPQKYKWPLEEEITFELPNGNYTAVFVGNTDKNLFKGQNGTEVLTSYMGDYSSARLNMPEKGPLAFNDYNMYYLCTVDFNQENASPHVLMQRAVSSSVYGRDMLNTNVDLNGLVQSLVDEIKNEQLTSDIVGGLLSSSLLNSLQDVPGLDALLLLTGGVTGLVDMLVSGLTAPIIDALYNALLDELMIELESALEGEGPTSLLGLGYILNPWTTVDNVDITYLSMPKSIDFNRSCTSYYENKTWTELPVTKNTKQLSSVSVISLCGEHKLSEINISASSRANLLGGLFGALDEKLLNSLLININTPLEYTTESNVQYSTRYELLNVTLNGFADGPTDDKVGLDIKLSEIIDLGDTLGSILGPLGLVLGSVLDLILNPVLGVVDGLVEALNIRLPGLSLSQIEVSGQWATTQASNETPILNSIIE